ncbi:serine-rich adhesin for platelets isoform X15 [Nematostella vectensis]|uniref:serine-rich adhesin for platelets isoform X14 n=1 Tax=Nematostella vectensis TaxID=45351 RepID=UPI0020773DF7|nr:serine-rich adhesin for platelets isoform X14 [Nematostella vectensis]XP_048581237.1 serine-rich adhesin for platelets isoform X15 [Nematostella vectensis]
MSLLDRNLFSLVVVAFLIIQAASQETSSSIQESSSTSPSASSSMIQESSSTSPSASSSVIQESSSTSPSALSSSILEIQATSSTSSASYRIQESSSTSPSASSSSIQESSYSSPSALSSSIQATPSTSSASSSLIQATTSSSLSTSSSSILGIQATPSTSSASSSSIQESSSTSPSASSSSIQESSYSSPSALSSSIQATSSTSSASSSSIQATTSSSLSTSSSSILEIQATSSTSSASSSSIQATTSSSLSTSSSSIQATTSSSLSTSSSSIQATTSSSLSTSSSSIQATTSSSLSTSSSLIQATTSSSLSTSSSSIQATTSSSLSTSSSSIQATTSSSLSTSSSLIQAIPSTSSASFSSIQATTSSSLSTSSSSIQAIPSTSSASSSSIQATTSSSLSTSSSSIQAIPSTSSASSSSIQARTSSSLSTSSSSILEIQATSSTSSASSSSIQATTSSSLSTSSSSIQATTSSSLSTSSSSIQAIPSTSSASSSSIQATSSSLSTSSSSIQATTSSSLSTSSSSIQATTSSSLSTSSSSIQAIPSTSSASSSSIQATTSSSLSTSSSLIQAIPSTSSASSSSIQATTSSSLSTSSSSIQAIPSTSSASSSSIQATTSSSLSTSSSLIQAIPSTSSASFSSIQATTSSSLSTSSSSIQAIPSTSSASSSSIQATTSSSLSTSSSSILEIQATSSTSSASSSSIQATTSSSLSTSSSSIQATTSSSLSTSSSSIQAIPSTSSASSSSIQATSSSLSTSSSSIQATTSSSLSTSSSSIQATTSSSLSTSSSLIQATTSSSLSTSSSSIQATTSSSLSTSSSSIQAIPSTSSASSSSIQATTSSSLSTSSSSIQATTSSSLSTSSSSIQATTSSSLSTSSSSIQASSSTSSASPSSVTSVSSSASPTPSSTPIPSASTSPVSHSAPSSTLISPSPSSSSIAISSSVCNPDCHGTCNGAAQQNECGVCYGGLTGKYSNSSKDCSGTCHGAATVDSCGNCTGGTTGRTAESAKDVCGVCHGTGSTCQGCDGVAKSGKVKDSCGVCGGDGTSCTALSGVKCPAVDKRSAVITFFGGGLNNGTAVNCKIRDPSTGAVLQTAQASDVTVTQGTCTIATWSGFAAGWYNLSISILQSDGTQVNVTGTQQLYFFDGAVTNFTSIDKTSILLTDLPQDIFIKGSGFFSGGGQYCYLGTSKVPATFINETTLKCTTPATAVSARILLLVTFNDGCSNITTNLQVTLEAPAPVLTKTQFTDSGAQIGVTFNTEVATAGLMTCSNIFDGPTMDKLGTNPTCTWTSKSTVMITPGPSATLSPGDTMTLNPNVIKADGQAYAKFASGSASIIQAPANPQSAQPVITGPTSLSVCGNLSLAGIQSSGSGGRPLKYEWRLKTSPSGVDTSALTAFLDGKNSSSLTINGNLMQSGQTYVFELCVSNFLNYANKACVQHTLSKTSVAGPRITVSAPLSDLNAKSVFVSQSFFIKAKAEAASCSNISAPKINFEWRVTCADLEAKAAIEGNADFTKTKNTANLQIAARVLKAGKTCTFTVKGIMQSQVAVYSEESIEINPQSTPLGALVIGGNRETGRTCSELRLQAQVTDLDLEDVVPNCTWACQTSTGATCGSATRVGQTISPASSCDSRVPCEEFRVGTTYIFTVTAMKRSRTTTAQTQIKVVSGSPPEVWVKQAEVKVVASNGFTLEGYYKSGLEPSLVEWKSISKEGYLVAQPGSLFQSYTKGSTSLAYSVFRQSLTKGAMYRFELQVTLDGAIGRAYIDVITRQGPTSGKLVASAATAEAFSSVELTAFGWIPEDDGAKPLTYTFKQGKITVYSGTSASCTAVVSTGQFSLKVTDAYGSSSFANLNITVTAPTDPSAAVSSVLAAASTLSDSGDPTQAVSSLAMLTGSSALASEEDKKKVQTALQDAVIEATKGGVSAETAEVVFSALSENPTEVTGTRSDELANTASKVIGSLPNPTPEILQDAAKIVESLDPTASAGSAQKISDLYDQIGDTAVKSLKPGDTFSIDTKDIKLSVSLTTGKEPVTSADGTKADVPPSAFCSTDPCEPVAASIAKPSAALIPSGETIDPNMAVKFSLTNAEGQKIAVNNLAEPIVISLPISGSSPPGNTFVCMFYDSARNVWSSDHVTTQYTVGDTEVKCLTTHLTTFGAPSKPSTPDVRTPPPGVEPAKHRLAVEINKAFFTNGWNDTVMANTSSPEYQAALIQVQNALARIFANQSYYGASEIILSSKDGKVLLTALLKFSPDTTGVLEAFKAGVTREGYQINSDSAVVTKESPAGSVPSEDDDTAAIIGGCVGGAVALLLLIGIVVYCNKAKKNKIKDASSEQAEEVGLTNRAASSPDVNNSA